MPANDDKICEGSNGTFAHINAIANKYKSVTVEFIPIKSPDPMCCFLKPDWSLKFLIHYGIFRTNRNTNNLHFSWNIGRVSRRHCLQFAYEMSSNEFFANFEMTFSTLQLMTYCWDGLLVLQFISGTYDSCSECHLLLLVFQNFVRIKNHFRFFNLYYDSLLVRMSLFTRQNCSFFRRIRYHSISTDFVNIIIHLQLILRIHSLSYNTRTMQMYL